MTDIQLRVLVMCEINFYEASVEPEHFQRALRELGWKATPDFGKATTQMLKRLAIGLRSKLRSASI